MTDTLRVHVILCSMTHNDIYVVTIYIVTVLMMKTVSSQSQKHTPERERESLFSLVLVELMPISMNELT